MIAILAALLLAAPFPSAPVTLDGVGALRIGMDVAALRRLGAAPGETPEEPGGCHYWSFPSQNQMGLMVIERRLVRIDIFDPAFRTRSGARVGMTGGEVRAIYGRTIEVRPHPYTAPDGHYLVYHPRRAAHGMIMETSGGRVESLRVGAWTHVQWIEGCQ
jgi:hypothetical protein